MKEEIMAFSLKQFLIHGIRKMTMQKLVSYLGISTKTMYKYFNNKEELLEECLKVHYKDTDKGLREMLDGSPNVVVSICRVYSKSIGLDFGTNYLFYYELNHYYPDLQDKIIKQYTSRVFKIITGIIKQGIAEGYFLSYLQAPVVLEALTILYTSVTRLDTYRKFGLNSAELIKHTIDIYLRGICTGKGLQIINELKRTV